MSDSDDTIRAKIVRTLHRGSFYEPQAIGINGLASAAPVASSDEGRVKTLADELAREEASPVIFKQVGKSVMLEVDSQQWVAAYIRRHDEEQLTWDLRNL